MLPGDDTRLGMLLTEVLLALYGAAEALPVAIVERKDGHLWVSPAEDEKLDALRGALNVTPALRRMQTIFELEDDDPEGEWLLRASPSVGGRQDSVVTASFTEMKVRNGERYYRFDVAGPVATHDLMYLSRASDRNPHGVVHRRLRRGHLERGTGMRQALAQHLRKSRLVAVEGGREPPPRPHDVADQLEVIGTGGREIRREVGT